MKSLSKDEHLPLIVAHYKSTRDQYLRNAIELSIKKEYRKASEMLWGAIAQELKALAASRGIKIYGLSDFHQFVRELAKELSDDYIRTEFGELRVLHNNFYDDLVDEEDFPTYFDRANKYIAKIDEILATF